MSAAFRDCEADYTSHLDSIRKDCATLTASLTPSAEPVTAAPPAAFNRQEIVARLLDQHQLMKTCLAHMELESNEGSAEQRALAKSKLVEFKRSAFKLEKDINRLKQESVAADRADLLRRVDRTSASGTTGAAAAATATGAAAGPNKGDEQLAQAVANTATVQRGSTTLTRALQYVVRMNELGDMTLVELRRQDETIDRVGGTADETQIELSGAQRLLRDMTRTAIKNHVVLAGVVILLIVMIVGILYFKFGRPLAAEWNAFQGGGAGTPSPNVGAPVVYTPAPNGAASILAALDGFAVAPSQAEIQSMFP